MILRIVGARTPGCRELVLESAPKLQLDLESFEAGGGVRVEETVRQGVELLRLRPAAAGEQAPPQLQPPAAAHALRPGPHVINEDQLQVLPELV